jgi:hypothetical protein
MNNPNLISTAEFEEITGAKHPAKQCEQLRKNGIRFTQRADGRPSLSWEAYNRQLSSAEKAEQHYEGPRIEAA